MTVREILTAAEYAARYMSIEIEALQRSAEIQRMAAGIGAVNYDRPVVQSSGSRGYVEQIATAIADADAAVADCRTRHMAAIAAARDLIATIDDAMTRSVLTLRYISGYDPATVAGMVSLSERSIRRIIADAINYLEAGEYIA